MMKHLFLPIILLISACYGEELDLPDVPSSSFDFKLGDEELIFDISNSHKVVLEINLDSEHIKRVTNLRFYSLDFEFSNDSTSVSPEIINKRAEAIFSSGETQGNKTIYYSLDLDGKTYEDQLNLEVLSLAKFADDNIIFESSEAEISVVDSLSIPAFVELSVTMSEDLYNILPSVDNINFQTTIGKFQNGSDMASYPITEFSAHASINLDSISVGTYFVYAGLAINMDTIYKSVQIVVTE